MLYITASVHPWLNVMSDHLIISSESLNLGGRPGTTDDMATILFHTSLSSAALRESPNPISVHSLMFSRLFFCLPLILVPFTDPCIIVFAMPEDLEMWPYHLSFRFFSMVRGDHHALQLHSGFCCKPPRSSHGLCRKCSEVIHVLTYNMKRHKLALLQTV